MFLLSPHVRMIESAVTCFRVLEHSTLDCNAHTVCVALQLRLLYAEKEVEVTGY